MASNHHTILCKILKLQLFIGKLLVADKKSLHDRKDSPTVNVNFSPKEFPEYPSSLMHSTLAWFGLAWGGSGGLEFGGVPWDEVVSMVEVFVGRVRKILWIVRLLIMTTIKF